MLADAAGAFPSVRETFDEASEALGYDLWALVSEGPEEQLTLTEFTQPAILSAALPCTGVGLRRAALYLSSLPDTAWVSTHAGRRWLFITFRTPRGSCKSGAGLCSLLCLRARGRWQPCLV